MDIDTQHRYLNEFKIDPIELGILCDKYPTLKNTWSQFLVVLEMCKQEEQR